MDPSAGEVNVTRTESLLSPESASTLARTFATRDDGPTSMLRTTTSTWRRVPAASEPS